MPVVSICSLFMAHLGWILVKLSGRFYRHSQVELLFSSLKGGYDGAAEDIKDWFPKQTELLGPYDFA